LGGGSTSSNTNYDPQSEAEPDEDLPF